MNVIFEELCAPQRAGGIEAACAALASQLAGPGNELIRYDATRPMPTGWRPDLVHLHGIWSPALMRRCSEWQSKGVPTLITIHGMLEPWALAHKKWKKRLAWLAYQKRILQGAVCFHATSEREACNLRALGLLPPIAMIPWGVAVEESIVIAERNTESDVESPEHSILQDPSTKLHHHLPTALQDPSTKLHHRPPTALFVGRLYPVKGLPLLLEAWARVRPPGWRLQLVGPDEAGHRSELEVLLGKLSLRESVEFLGPRAGSELSDCYRRADLFILPSHSENFGIVVAEALAHGLPVITTHGAPWKRLETDQCGWWVPVSVDGLAGALIDATGRSSEDLAAIGARGRTLVGDHFTWESVATQMKEVYGWMLGDGEKPGCVDCRGERGARDESASDKRRLVNRGGPLRRAGGDRRSPKPLPEAAASSVRSSSRMWRRD